MRSVLRPYPMNCRLRLAGSHQRFPPLYPTGSLRSSHPTISMTRTRLYHFSIIQCNRLPLCSITNNAYGSSDDGKSCSTNDKENSLEETQSGESQSFSSKELLKKLKRYGISGVLSYGLLNTVYYTTAFLLVWFYVTPAPGKLGYIAAVERFLKVMAMVWAGSQVTKLVRAGGALALAPMVDRGLSWFTVKFKFESQAKAFITIVGFCLGLAVLLFLVLTLLWA